MHCNEAIVERPSRAAARGLALGLLCALAVAASPAGAQEPAERAEEASPSAAQAGETEATADAPEAPQAASERSEPAGVDQPAAAEADGAARQVAEEPAGGGAGEAAADEAAADEAADEEGELLQRLLGDMEALKRLKLSFYVQTDVRAEDIGSDQVDGGLQLRRGRVKFTYRHGGARYVFELDGSGSGRTRVLDMNLRLTLSDDEDLRSYLTVGQFKVPFGTTVQISSSKRPFPERYSGIRALFPGERDLGGWLALQSGAWTLDVAWLNGGPVQDPFRSQYSWLRPSALGDVLLRLTGEAGPVRGGFSAVFGQGWRPGQEDDPETAQDESFEGFSYDRWALAAHLQLNLDSGLRAQAELVYARNLARRRVSHFPTPEDRQRDMITGYLWALQPLGEVVSVGARFGATAMDEDPVQSEIEPLLHLQMSRHFRVQLAYRASLQDATDNDAWLRLQLKY